MFEAAELGNRIGKTEYKVREPALRVSLLQAQRELRKACFPVMILISGVDGAGKGETLNLLNEWMDPRYLRAHAFGAPTDEERERPPFWRFWLSLPPRGSIGIYVGSWYSEPIAARIRQEISETEFDRRLQRIRTFERMLVDDGALVIKFWLHLSQKTQKQRLKSLEKDPETAWRVTEQDRAHLKLYDRFRSVAERALRETGTGDAPWTIVEAADKRYRNLTVGQHILERMHERFVAARTSGPPDRASHEATVARPHTLLDQLDLTLSLPKSVYRKELKRYHSRLGRLARETNARKRSSIVLLEGWDAAGKGGIIRRIVPAIDARNYRVIPVSAPSDEERAHHYLWRFWRHLPRAGSITLYDRSWYGRVLVERVEGYASRDEWMRAYGEINDFEEQLTGSGCLLLKLWVHIDPEEQIKRFQARERTPWKQYKITGEDYRNRAQRGAYEQAVADMVERTSTEYAPWTLIEGNDKRYARIKALRTFCERLEAALETAR